MPILFASKIGSVIELVDPGLQCDLQILGLDPDITFRAQRSIVTRFTLSHKVNVQFLHTLGSLIYIYVFGDRMGQITLSGLAFGCECPSGNDIGAELMLLWYKANRCSKRKTPVRVTIGKQAIDGFITDFNEDVVDPSISLVQWGVTLACLPEDDNNEGSSGGPTEFEGSSGGGEPSFVPSLTGPGGGPGFVPGLTGPGFVPSLTGPGFVPSLTGPGFVPGGIATFAPPL